MQNEAERIRNMERQRLGDGWEREPEAVEPLTLDGLIESLTDDQKVDLVAVAIAERPDICHRIFSAYLFDDLVDMGTLASCAIRAELDSLLDYQNREQS